MATKAAHQSYGDVAELESSALRTLLVEGEPSERVWAAWALGVRGGLELSAETKDRFLREPDSGARRHFIMFLLGSGERAAVEALAGFDPDWRVRATACLGLLRTAPTDAHTLQVVHHVLTSDVSDDVREDVLRGLPSTAASLEPDVLVSFSGSSSEGVRRALYNALVNLPAQTVEAIALCRLPTEQDPDLLKVLVDRGLASKSEKLREAALRAVVGTAPYQVRRVEMMRDGGSWVASFTSGGEAVDLSWHFQRRERDHRIYGPLSIRREGRRYERLSEPDVGGPLETAWVSVFLEAREEGLPPDEADSFSELRRDLRRRLKTHS